jgi:gluconolactonase
MLSQRSETMKMSVAAFCLCAVCAMPAFGQGQAPAPPATDTVAPDIPGVVKAGTKVIVIKDDFQGTEGPIALPDGTVAFTEGGANRITRIDRDSKVSVYLDNTNGSNALAFDSKGRLISVQRGPAHVQIGVIAPKGSEATLADNFEGNPNDLVVTKNDGVYFTVPGPLAQARGSAPPPAPFVPAVYYIAPNSGKAAKVADGITNPNGIQLSPDEKTIYVNDTRGEYLIAMEVQPGGTLGPKRNFAKYEGVQRTDAGVASGADGLAVDNDGRVYAATAIGVQVFSPKGQHLGTIPLSRAPQNLAFAGPDKKTLYVVGRNAAWKIQMLSSGYKGRAK